MHKSSDKRVNRRFIMVRCFAESTPIRLVVINRKCGVDFVYLNEGCGKTSAVINDTIPHT